MLWGGHDAFLGKLTSLGAGVWLKAFLGTGATSETVNGIVVMPTGDVAISGPFDNVINLGGASLDFANGGHAFMAKLSTDRVHLWSTNHGGSSVDLARAPSGDLILTGTFASTVNLGGGPVSALGSPDVFVGTYDTNGNYQSAVTLGSPSGAYASRVHFSAAGDLLLLGWFVGPVDLGGATLTPVGADGILAKLTL
jgi:hypothetical protein